MLSFIRFMRGAAACVLFFCAGSTYAQDIASKFADANGVRVFTRMDEPIPALAPFAGRYHSDETATDYTVRLDGARYCHLYARGRRGRCGPGDQQPASASLYGRAGR